MAKPKFAKGMRLVPNNGASGGIYRSQSQRDRDRQEAQRAGAKHHGHGKNK